MSFKAKKPCSTPGCRELTNGGPCPKHAKSRQTSSDSNRCASHKRGYDHLWRKVRERKLRKDPICECGCGQLADCVHHKIPVSERPDLRLTMSNLMSLTNDCHERIEHENGRRVRFGKNI